MHILQYVTILNEILNRVYAFYPFCGKQNDDSVYLIPKCRAAGKTSARQHISQVKSLGELSETFDRISADRAGIKTDDRKR